jgi:hypothetical protein
MKIFTIILLILSVSLATYSQEKILSQGNIEPEKLPAVVIKRAGADFSVYIPDDNPDQTVIGIEKKFIAYDLGKDYEGFENYLVLMSTKNGSLAATYNEEGKLIRVVENYKNIRLPNEVIYSIYRAYPEWTIVKDKYLYTQKDADILKKVYNLKIKKGRKNLKLTVRPNGQIVKVR